MCRFIEDKILSSKRAPALIMMKKRSLLRYDFNLIFPVRKSGKSDSQWNCDRHP
ncbi:hypothetical protein HOLDEFILI_00794 [Holdemania filiformis DSM 12042]|uniref:Uncharacterized protein n=1 Tax=Holdemania filiformis DSM 12042 TaxID=545696 RepID=B9Y4R3_9FIRM|nr:hypothetical protein HOLDEFILI_00794 [Holdemania filiformis DSM 12042]